MSTSTPQRSSETSGQDRTRARAERGIRSTSAANQAARDAPSPPRRRRPALAALAVLLIVGGAVLAALLAIRLDAREPVLVVNQDVSAGEQITRDMLAQADVAAEGSMLIPTGELDTVLDTHARVAISQGQLLDTSMLTTAEPVSDGRALVGVPLVGGRVPPGLRSGDLVRLVRLGDGNEPATPISTGLMTTMSSSEAESLAGGESSSTGNLLVPQEAADAVVDAAGNEILGIALLDRGVPVDEADLTVLGGDS